ncbi:(2Fe-2S)-binding protein [Clostridium sp. UBA4548]|uniref:(2Fe-2S)-binding protein n=1 Tax=Clostridium sp. UBA4548 TaxID=1946361 RepID=UPI0025C66494|nr:(2Fe-2S)-binding protein [Clostridium sp. UBA4548]
MENNLNEEILDKLTKVCICKGIPRSTIKKAIANGAKTVEEVNRVTGSGSGGCKGRRCSVKIAELIKQYNEANEIE